MASGVVAHWCDFLLGVVELGDLVLCLVQHGAFLGSCGTLLLRLGPLTSGSPSGLVGVLFCTRADDVWIRDQWGGLDALTALLSGVHRGVLSLGRALGAHRVHDAWGDHVVELVIWAAGEQVWDLLGGIVS